MPDGNRQAADISKQINKDGTLIVTISGEIEMGDETKFKDIIPVSGDPRHVIVKLNSKGGWNRAAELHRPPHAGSRGYEATVEKGARCNSACTLIFFAGTYRTMEAGTRLGFHSAWPEGIPAIRDENANKKIGEYLAWMGAPQQVIYSQPKADPCCLNYLSQKELKAMGALKERESPAVAMDRTPELLEPTPCSKDVPMTDIVERLRK